MINKIGLLGCKGFVGSAVALELKKNKVSFIGITRKNYRKFINKKFKYIINCSNPSKRFWARKNPTLDFKETVQKTKFFLENYKFEKFIHISSISSRCQIKTVYGSNKKKAEKLVSKTKNYLIIRLGPMFHKTLDKGVIIDLLESSNVYLSSNSKYSFTNLEWIAKWIIKNMKTYCGTIEIGSQDYFILKDLAKKISSKSKFYGKIDNQLIKSKFKFNTSSKEILNFLDKNDKY